MQQRCCSYSIDASFGTLRTAERSAVVAAVVSALLFVRSSRVRSGSAVFDSFCTSCLAGFRCRARRFRARLATHAGPVRCSFRWFLQPPAFAALAPVTAALLCFCGRFCAFVCALEPCAERERCFRLVLHQLSGWFGRIIRGPAQQPVINAPAAMAWLLQQAAMQRQHGRTGL